MLSRCQPLNSANSHFSQVGMGQLGIGHMLECNILKDKIMESIFSDHGEPKLEITV